MLSNFTSTLNGFLSKGNYDVYVTGSNSKMLSSDIITSFRGRGDQIRIYPLSFEEYFSAFKEKDFDLAYEKYSYYGGMPLLLSMDNDKQKTAYLNNLFKEIYIKDIVERNGITNQDSFERLINVLASSIGSYTSPTNIENTFKSRNGVAYSHEAIKRHIEYLQDSFLISEVKRFDIKGRQHINAKAKYYFTDIGLRNARLNFVELEPPRIMENIIYNELLYRGYNVVIGTIPINEKNKNGNYVRKQLEVDFVATTSNKKYYIQCAYSIDIKEKLSQEEKSLTLIFDSFKKVIVVKDRFHYYYLDSGVLVISLKDFLTNRDSLDL